MNPKTTALLSFLLLILVSPARPAEDELKMFARQKPVGQTWIEHNGDIFGARPDERGPIGGGAGYVDVVTTGDMTASGLDQLLDALKKAKAGQTVFLPGDVEIDCSTRVYIDRLVLEIPTSVTLASDRGSSGSQGALIFSDVFATHPLIRAAGPNVRLTGIRLRGPDPSRRLDHHRRSFNEGRGSEYYYKFPTSDGVETEHPGLRVDNCELAGWSHAAVNLKAGDRHRIHHNYIHHNQRQGLGYGVCHDRAESLIEYNLFDFNRHSIAGTGRPGSGYEANCNVELGDSLSHCFDMHGGRDRKDGTDIAGDWMRIHHNTFRAQATPIVIRGIPEKEARIQNNFFPRHTPSTATRHGKNTTIKNNWYNQ